MFRLEVGKEGTQTRARLIGDLDIEATEVMEEELTPLLLKAGSVELDFSEVPFVDSTGIGLLITMIHAIHDNGGKIVITNLCADVRQVFELLQLQDIVGRHVFADAKNA